MKDNVNKSKAFLLDIFYPRYCLGCSRLIEELSESHLCPLCRLSVPLKNEFVCAFCDSPVILGKTCPFCRTKRDSTNPDLSAYWLDRLIVASNYESPLVEKIIKAVKYHFIKSLSVEIGEVMADFFIKNVLSELELNPASIVATAVPLHPRRLNWRGYNQSKLIALEVSRLLGWQYLDLLIRVRNNPPQAEIKDRQTRISNLNGVFRLASEVNLSGKTIILIDDVSTTGSTLNECARMLKSLDPKEVIGFVFARNR